MKKIKFKTCKHCLKQYLEQAYRVQKSPRPEWIFVCGKCCLELKKGEYYRYGGTWKARNTL